MPVSWQMAPSPVAAWSMFWPMIERLRARPRLSVHRRRGARIGR
jgi:hypothetical protein